MSDKKYVLRAREFGYDDEYYDFYGDGSDGRINSSFSDKALALKSWKASHYTQVSAPKL